jgi:hypothetical protein
MLTLWEEEQVWGEEEGEQVWGKEEREQVWGKQWAGG